MICDEKINELVTYTLFNFEVILFLHKKQFFSRKMNITLLLRIMYYEVRYCTQLYNGQMKTRVSITLVHIRVGQGLG